MSAILNILSMFGPLRALKFWVAVVMAATAFVRIYAGIDLGLDEATATAVMGGIGALLVWLVPNVGPKQELPTFASPEEAVAEAERQTGKPHVFKP